MEKKRGAGVCKPVSLKPYKTVSGRWGEGILKFREFVRTWEENLHQFYTK